MTHFKAYVSAATACAMMAAAAPALADGFYFSSQTGSAKLSDELSGFIKDGGSFRFAFGRRQHQWAAEVWAGISISERRATCGDDCTLQNGIANAFPQTVGQLGIDAKYFAPLGGGFEAYVRGGVTKGYTHVNYAEYAGRGLSGGAGLQLKGEWGPKVTVAIFAETGLDFYRLQSAGRPTIDAQFNTMRLGLAIGSDF